jgi:hypothetical protein
MKAFLARFSEMILGVINGFDRFVIRGFLRPIQAVPGMKHFLWNKRVRLTEFGDYAHETTEKVKAASLRAAEESGRPMPFVSAPRTDKAEVAQALAQEQGVTEGLIAVVRSVEVCPCYGISRNHKEKKLDLVLKSRPCLHYYHYLLDPVFGFMNARLQTWFPFHIQICLNGREWLARAMDREGLRYEKRENCFVWIDDIPRAQGLMDEFLRTAWPEAFDRIRQRLNPVHEDILGSYDARYYWTGHQTEWASDVLFRKPQDLAELHPALVRHALFTFQSPHIMRFLGQKLGGNFQGEVTTHYDRRPEGVCVRHAVKTNSIKFYDKQGSVLRVETTVNNPGDFKVFRPKEGDPDGPRSWREMRKGIADLHRRAEVCQAANDRYIEALAATDTSARVGPLVEPLTRPTRWHRQRVRGLRPWSEEDRTLLEAILRGEFVLKGFRNGDLQALLFPQKAPTREEQRRRRSKVTRYIRMLRAHRIVHKVPSENRYLLSPKGREILVALSATQNLTLQEIKKAAA